MDVKLGVVEAQFADIVWEHAPLTTKELIILCEQQLQWKRTTTYTVLKKLCDKGLFQMQDRLVTICISRDDFYALQSEQFVDETFSGSLPAFIAAFSKRRKLSTKELEEIRQMIDSFGKESL